MANLLGRLAKDSPQLIVYPTVVGCSDIIPQQQLSKSSAAGRDLFYKNKWMTWIANGYFSLHLTFKRQSHKMAKHTQTIRQIADELFECVWPLC